MKYISIIIIVLFPLFIMEFENTGNCKTIVKAQNSVNQQADDSEDNKADDSDADPVSYIKDIVKNMYDKEEKPLSVSNKKEKKKKAGEPTFSEKCRESQKKSDGDSGDPAVVKVVRVVEKVRKPLQRGKTRKFDEKEESEESNAEQKIDNGGDSITEEIKNQIPKLGKEEYSLDPSPNKQNIKNNPVKEIKTLKEKELEERSALFQEKSRLSGANEFIKTECRSNIKKDTKSKLIEGK